MLFLGFVAAVSLVSTRTIAYGGTTYSASIVPASKPNLPPLVLLPPIGVGIDRTFCGRFLEAWAEAAPGSALHAIDVIGMGDSQPKPKMKRPFGGWDEPPRTPAEWAEQTLSYIRDEVGEPCVVVGQSNLCAVALEAAAKSGGEGRGGVSGIVLIGPPAIEALSIDKPQEKIDKVWRLVGTPIGAALFRFARRKAFLGSFSHKNLFADPSQVDDAYLDVCEAGAADASSRHAVFSFVAGSSPPPCADRCLDADRHGHGHRHTHADAYARPPVTQARGGATTGRSSPNSSCRLSSSPGVTWARRAPA